MLSTPEDGGEIPFDGHPLARTTPSPCARKSAWCSRRTTFSRAPSQKTSATATSPPPTLTSKPPRAKPHGGLSHSLAQIVDSDCIYVMKKGHLVKRGTHDALYDMKGTYREIFDAFARSLNIEQLAKTMAHNGDEVLNTASQIATFIA